VYIIGFELGGALELIWIVDAQKRRRKNGT